MSVDLHEMKAGSAVRAGDVVVRRGEARLRRTTQGNFGTLTFPLVEPDAMVLWVAASLNGVLDNSTDAIRIRLSNGTTHYYFDESDNLRVKPVTDQSVWTDEYFGPDVLGSLDLWTQQGLQLIVCLFSTKDYPDPRCRSALTVMNFPAWEGAVSQTVTEIAKSLALVRPILIHEEALTSDRSEWKLGNDHSERGYVLTELVQVTVNNRSKSAQLSDGVVSLDGPKAQVGDVVKIAVRFKPGLLVRRTDEVHAIEKLPTWLLTNLVQNRTRVTSGRLSPLEVSGVRVYRRMLDLQITFRGVGGRQVDALSMRDAVLSHFNGGVEIVLDSCRSLAVALDDSVEVTPRSGEGFPEAVGQLRCVLHEYTGYERVVNARTTDDEDNVVVQTTTVAMTIGEAEFPTTVDSSTIESGSTSSDC